MPLPRLWEIEAEREADAERNEVDLALEQEYEDELELETSREAELHSGFASFKDDAEDDEKVQSFTLSPVPPASSRRTMTTGSSRSTACATGRASSR